MTTSGLVLALATFAEARWPTYVEALPCGRRFRARRKVWGGTGIVADIVPHEQLELELELGKRLNC